MAKYLPGLGAAAWGGFVYALLPQGLVALNDDFAYLRSVVATLQHGRPWTDDWLEPWSAGLSLLSAGLFRGTGSFYFATYGLLALLAAVSFFAVCRLLASRGITGGRALLLAALGLTFPTLLWKQVQFTGLVLYLPCLLVALEAAEKRRWGIFMVAWALAFSTRQTALAWAVLPLAALAHDWWRERRLATRMWLAPALCLLGGGALYLALGRLMNKTAAQRLVTDRMWNQWSLAQAGDALLIGGLALLLAAGWGAWALRSRTDAANPGRPWPRGVGVRLLVAGALSLAVNVRSHIAFEFETFESAWGMAYLKIVVILGVAGLALGKISGRPLPLAGAVTAIAALSLRPVIWDYYLVDVCVFGFFAVQSVPGEEPVRSPVRWLGWAAIIPVVLFQAFATLQIKGTLDRTHVLFELGSQVIEEGRLAPDHSSFLPFGLMAWYYFPLHLQHEARRGAALADFGRYLEQDQVLIAWRYSKALRGLPGHEGGLPEDRSQVIAGGKFNYCWLYGVEVLLLPAPPEARRPAKSPYPPDYRVPRFPRDDAGWRELIADETKLVVPGNARDVSSP